MPNVNLTAEQVALLVSVIDKTPIQGIAHLERWAALGRKLQASLPKTVKKE